MRRLLIYGCALASGTLASAHDSALGRCRTIADAATRLACYDALPLVAAPVAATAAAAAVTPAAATPTSTATPGTGATPKVAAPSTTPADTFGLEQRAQAREDSITSHIEGRFDGWGPSTQFRLANGQTWQVSDGSSGVYNLTNPKVRVRRGVMGSFHMEFEGQNRTVRVRRLQ